MGRESRSPLGNKHLRLLLRLSNFLKGEDSKVIAFLFLVRLSKQENAMEDNINQWEKKTTVYT